MVSAYSALPGGDQEKPSTGRSRTRRWPTSKLLVPPRPLHPLQPLHSLKTSSEAAQQNAAKSSSTPSFATGSSTCRTSRRQNGDGACSDAWVRSSACAPGCSTRFSPYRWKRSAPRAAPLGKKTLLSPADVTRLSEHIMRVTDVLCLSGLTIHSPVLDWFDAKGHDVRPAREWVRRLLRSMRLSYKKPAQCVKELHSREQQHANTQRLFIKLCWQMSTCGVSTDRVVNIDETSCQLLPVQQIGWGCGVKQAQLQGNTKEATTFLRSALNVRVVRISNKRGCGSPVKAQASARVDVPTACFFLQCGPRSPTRV